MTLTDLDSATRLSRDLVKAAVTLGPAEVRFLVDGYYMIQESRKRSANQLKALSESAEPHAVLDWFFDQSKLLEGQIKRALQGYAEADAVASWALSIVGIGPVISAGLRAHIDVTDPETSVGKKWAFAGLDPTRTWGKGEKRPWNASLKTLCWKIGESFVKQKGHEDDFYGALYDRRKAYESARNEQGLYREQAEAKLKKWNVKDKDAKATMDGSWTRVASLNPAYAEALKDLPRVTVESGGDRKKAGVKDKPDPAAVAQLDAAFPDIPKLLPAALHERSKRWAVKMFLSHYVDVAYQLEHGKPLPAPFAIAKLGHTTYIAPPNPPEWWRQS